MQPINAQMNLHSGISLNKVKEYQLDYPDPAQGYGGLYMDRAVLQKKISRVREDEAYYQWLSNNDTHFRPILDMWRDASSARLGQATKGVTELSQRLLEALVNGHGIYEFHTHYWMGGLQMGDKALWIDQILMQPNLTPEQKAALKASAVLFAHILSDDDFVPLFDGHGLNLGTPNMPVQYRSYRDFFTLFLAGHPMMKGRVEEIEERTLSLVKGIINESGAAFGSVHYMQPTIEPTISTLLMLKRLGKDNFKTEPRLRKFAEFYMNFLTPEDTRFGSGRKLPAIGDGGTEGSVLPGLMATGFRDADPKLAARLMGAWNAMGKIHSSFFGSTVLKIDEEAPSADPQMQSATYPGWNSVLRSGWGTPNENALWFVNGDFYSDHRHADYGSVVAYALGAPLSLEWSSFYTPHIWGGVMHSMVLPENKFGHAWDASNVPVQAGDYGVWKNSQQTGFKGQGPVQQASARFVGEDVVWTRRVILAGSEAQPVIVLRDSFEGRNAAQSKVLTLNLMAEGAVNTSAGEMTPPARVWNRFGGAQEMPSAGQVFALKAGLNRLGFSGQQGIDFDVYLFSDAPQQAHIGNWGFHWRRPGDDGRQFIESQHILRVRGSGPFTTLIVPRKKGAARPQVEVAPQGANLLVTVGAQKIMLEQR